MARSLSSFFHLIFMTAIFLCLQIHASPFLHSPSMEKSIINAYANSSGIVDLKKDSQGFYVEADLSYRPSDSSSREQSNITTPGNDDTVKMMISLSNSASMVASSCLNFSYYDCGKYNCEHTRWQAEINYPSFIASTIAGQAPIYLDKKYWMLTENTTLYLASSCETRDNTSSIGLNRFGVLGLGTNNGAKYDFQVSQKFSISIESDLSAGKLIFTDDKSNYTNSSEPLYTLPANSTWQLTVPRGYVEVTNYAIAFDKGNIIFDVNSDVIGLPFNIFQLFINYFLHTPDVAGKMWCSPGFYKPYCYTPKTVQDLPDIFISFNDTKIRIPFKIYTTPDGDMGYNSSYFYLNLKATSPSLSDHSYVAPAFKDSIILGANFMSYYFTVFDAKDGNNMVSLYPVVPVDDGFNPTNWIGIGAAAVVFLTIICCCAAAKRKTGGDVNKNATTIVTNTTQEPLVYNYTAYNSQPQGVVYQQPQRPLYNN